jgi:hypothetical protein
VAETLDPALVVYDCLGLQDAADAAHAADEAALLRRADLVFTAGPTLYEAQRHRHPRVHCLPNAVDAAHFAPAGLDPDDLQADLAAALQGALPRPRLGFFGVIDQRIDLALLAGVADARPAWQLVLAGPVAGLDPAMLPQRPNIHWLGQQPYARLPHLLAGWDLALMPFALTDATAALSPTMTLEYLAGEKPVVSTPLRDVARLHGHVLRLAGGVLDFVAACEETLAETPRQRSRRVMEMLATVSTLSWDRTAAAVHALIEEARAAREPETADDPVPTVAAAVHAPAGQPVRPAGRSAHCPTLAVARQRAARGAGHSRAGRRQRPGPDMAGARVGQSSPAGAAAHRPQVRSWWCRGSWPSSPSSSSGTPGDGRSGRSPGSGGGGGWGPGSGSGPGRWISAFMAAAFACQRGRRQAPQRWAVRRPSTRPTASAMPTAASGLSRTRLRAVSAHSASISISWS